MNTVTIKYGIDQHTHTFAGSMTIGEVVANPTVKAILGYGDNVKALISGVEQPLGAQLANGMVVVLETKANNKAS